MSIARRMFLAFAVMIGLTLGVGLLGLGRMRSLNDTTTRITEERYGKVRLAQRGVEKINRNSRVALHLFLITDPVEFERAVAGQVQTSADITEVYRLFEERIDLEPERALFDAIKSARARYVTQRAVAADALRAGRRAEAQQLFEREVSPELDAYIEAWNALLDFEGLRMKEAAADAREGYARGRATVIALSVLAGLIGFVVALRVSRRITWPLLAIARAAERLERGELAARVELESADEIGTVARAFNLMGDAVRFRQERLEREVNLAQQIQTAILPRDLVSPGFEVSAAMTPATEVGGDYYDVLPVRDGSWFAIGDVSGHGLNAGLIMLMMQSSVSTLVRVDPDATPRSIVGAVNRVLYENIRERLQVTSHATMVLLKARKDGHVTFAGAHEPLLVCRARTRRCESIETPGAWVGGVQDVDRATVDSTLQLEDGDVMVLFTDGITEAQNADGEMLGLERLSAEIERLCDEPVDRIREGILSMATRWAPAVADDLSVVVARHRRSSLTDR